METKKRTLIKTLTWRVVAILVTLIAAYLFNKDFEESLYISIIANGVKAFLYYMHERFWNRINYGRQLPEYNI